jgi:O-antigen/teichoic acid export membrane protein
MDILFKMRNILLKYKINFLEGVDSRTVKAKKNIVISFFVKGFSILIMFALVPLLINQLNGQKYGVWLTLASFISWFTFFDVGLGNGLKNILIEKLSNKDIVGAKKAISTAYVSIGIVISILFCLFIIGNQFLNWAVILNAPGSMLSDLNSLIFFVVISFCLQLILRLISSIYDAIQMPAASGIITALGNLLTIIFVLFLILTANSHSLLYYGIALTISPLVALLIGTIYFFRFKCPELVPSIAYFDKTIVKLLFGLGAKFFLIQITSIMLYQTNSFVIAHFVGTNAVTTYDIAYKYGGISQMVFLIVLSPLWVASGDAYYKNNISWIYKAISKLNKLILILAVFAVLQLIFSKQFYYLWIGSKVNIDYSLTFLMLFYFIVSMRGGLYCMVLNGIGKIKLQFILNLLEALIHIPLSIFLAKYWGVNGVVVSMCLIVSLNAIWMPIQCKLILEGKAKGLWNK